MTDQTSMARPSQRAKRSASLAMLYTIGARFPVVARLPRPVQFLIRRSLVEIPCG